MKYIYAFIFILTNAAFCKEAPLFKVSISDFDKNNGFVTFFIENISKHRVFVREIDTKKFGFTLQGDEREYASSGIVDPNKNDRYILFDQNDKKVFKVKLVIHSDIDLKKTNHLKLDLSCWCYKMGSFESKLEHFEASKDLVDRVSPK